MTNIILSSDDWSPALKTSKFHLASNLSKTEKVYFFNSPGMRNIRLASLSDWRRALDKVRGHFRKDNPATDNGKIRIVTPMVVPYISFWKLGINDFFYGKSIRRVLNENRREEITYWVFHPMISFIKRHPGDRIVYYCVDEHSLFEKVDTAFVRKRESELLRRADLVIFTSKKLLEEKKSGIPEKDRILYVPHGVDLDNFRLAAPTGDLKIDRDMYSSVVGFFGAIHDWVDLDLISKLALANPRTFFILIGSVKVDISGLESRQNVLFTGPIPYTELAGYASHFDVGMIPFKENEMTKYVNPLKAREYLACGVPVISTNLPELELIAGDHVRVTKSHDEFICGIAALIGSAKNRNRHNGKEKIRDCVLGDSWANRLDVIRTTLHARTT